MLEVYFRCSMTLDCLKNQVEAVTHVKGSFTEGFPIGLSGWVVSLLNPNIRIFMSFLVGWSCSPGKPSLIYCLEKEGLASGILRTGSERRLGLSALELGPCPALCLGIDFQSSFREGGIVGEGEDMDIQLFS